MKVELEFPGADISTYDEATFLESLAKALNIPLEYLVILDVRSGSIIVNFAILPPVGEDEIESDIALALEQMLSSGAIEVPGYGSANVNSYALPPAEKSDALILGLSLVPLGILAGVLLFMIFFLYIYWRRSKSKVAFLESKLVDVDALNFDQESLLQMQNPMKNPAAYPSMDNARWAQR